MSRAGDGIVVLFALEREAVPFRRAARGLDKIRTHITGVGCKRARAALEQILSVSPSPSLVISAGFCGALQPSLKVGEIVVASEIVDQAGHVWPVGGIRQQINQPPNRFLTVNHLIATAAEKQRLGEYHKAVAVDMESAAIAEVCASRGVQFLAVRAVSDAADTELSPELVRLLSGGRVSVWKALKALARKPSLLGEFRLLARDTRLAARNLADTLLRIART